MTTPRRSWREPQVGATRVERRTYRTLYYWPSACARVVRVPSTTGPYLTTDVAPCCERWLTRAQFDALRAIYAAEDPPAQLGLGRRCPGCGRGLGGNANVRWCGGPCKQALANRARRDADRLMPVGPPPFDPWTLRPDLWRPAGAPEHLTPDALRQLAPDDPDDLDGPRYARRLLPDCSPEGEGAYSRRLRVLADLEASPNGVAAPPTRPTTSACGECGGRWTAQQWTDANGACTWRGCPSRERTT